MTALDTLAHAVWDAKYRAALPDGRREASIDETWARVAAAIARPERQRARWEAAFLEILRDFRFLPGGRILAGAGTGRDVTLFNCFVMGPLDDAPARVFQSLAEGARTMMAGGGAGYDFSSLRPRGMPLPGGGSAAGPLSHMRLWEAMCANFSSASARRGAMMASLRCDHPDIEAFVDAKRVRGELQHFNLSVLVTDAFMAAVEADREWALDFAAPGWGGAGCGAPEAAPRRIPARELWRRIVRNAFEVAEPGVIFIDRINAENSLAYCERIGATNPCGEVPLPAYGACDLGSINLTRFVRAPFTPEAAIDLAGIAQTVAVAVRFLDNVYDVSTYPLPEQRAVALRTRRLGLGLTGLADALLMLGRRYDDEASGRLAGDLMRHICVEAYRASIELARERGPFPAFETHGYLHGEFSLRLPADLRDLIERHGVRNSHLTAIAPAGSISLLAGNVSSGLEPVFAPLYQRSLRQPDGSLRHVWVEDYAHRLWREARGLPQLPESSGPHPPPPPEPDALVTVHEVSPVAQLAMQASLQPWVDNAISKTVTVPVDFPFERFESLYAVAYRLGLKGCTAYRPNPITGQVLLDPAIAPADTSCRSVC